MRRKIIFDASVLVSGNISGNIHKTGLYRVSYEILQRLIECNNIDIYIFDVFNRERELKKYVQNDFPKCNRIKVYSILYRLLIFPLGDFADYLRNIQKSYNNPIFLIFAGLLKNCLLLIEKAAKKIESLFFINLNLKKWINKCDIYYSTYFPIPEQVRMNRNIKKVYTVHDIIPIIHPEYFSSSFNEKILIEVIDNIKTDDFVISVSESTKRDILKYRHDLIEKQIIVSHLAASDKFYKVTDFTKIEYIKNKYKINCEKYILSVCTIEPRKNLGVLIKAYKSLLENTPEFNVKLVLIGSYGWNSGQLIKDIEEINSNYQTPIILTGFIPDDDLADLYSGAFMFVYPSLYEGFGLPVLEAMQCGLPVITSNNSSLPEVVGDSGILIDPSDNIALENAIKNLYNNPDLRQSLTEKSLLRAKKFNWEKTSKTIVDTINLEVL